MKCPMCANELSILKVDSTNLDLCKGGCGGIWFDAGELVKFDENKEFIGKEVLEAGKNRKKVINPPLPKQCPKCETEPLIRQFLDHKNEIEMDQCWNCGGVWLDQGELSSLRNQYNTFEERRDAANHYAEGILSEATNVMKAEGALQIAKYEGELSYPFAGAIYAVKKLLGFDPDPSDGL